jgi:acyl transferase domain-containing protein
MAAAKIEAALAQLASEVSDCEQALLRLIRVRKNMSENSQIISEINSQLSQINVAIIGMASIFPQSKNLQEYWEKIIQKADCITDVPASRWSIDDYYDPDPKAPDKTYCKRGGFLPDIDFNPMEFGLPPNILEVTDISQLLGLVVAKAALSDAGYGDAANTVRDRTGVVLGVAIGRQLAVPLGTRLQYPVWEKVLKNSGLSEEDTQKIITKIKSAYVQWEENAFPGMLANVISGRIANRLDLGGMNCVVDAACASSLGALKVAISELVEHRADMMLTGGVDTDNSIFAYMCFSKTPAVSPGERVKPFDAESDGMMLGEGVGMLVLKRLEDAQRDNDRIYAVIKGIGTSSDGKYKSIYAPRPEGQIKALRRAYAEAGFSPTTVGLIEAHGTGTMVGDPTEFTAIAEVFGENNPKTQHIALGSVKSQIGHTKAAAGAASLIKTALALYHKVLPPTINVTQPHPKLNIENSPFYLNTETRPWINHCDQPRRAGVSSFGFGGTNYHVVLEEYTREHHQAYRLHPTPETVLISAPTPAALLSRCTEVQQQLQSDQSELHYRELVVSCQNAEIPVNYARLGFVANSLGDAKQLLKIAIDGLKSQGEAEFWQHPKGIYYRHRGIDTTGKVVALFSGQGSQYLEMGREVVMNFPSLRQAYTEMDRLLSEDNLQPISEVVFPAPVFTEAEKKQQVEILQKTEYAQPAIGTFSLGLYKILQQAGFKPDFVAGHSFGEITALWAAGVLSESDYLFLVKARGQAMATPSDAEDAGGMLAVQGDVSQVQALIRDFPQVAVANWNSPQQVVLAGKKAEITQVEDILKARGLNTTLLGVGAAFHTTLVAHAQKPFAQAIEQVQFQPGQIPVYSNVTGQCYPSSPSAVPKILKEHLLNQVQFQQEIENIYAAGGYCFVEFGPKNILTNLVKEILGDKPYIAVAVNPHHTKNSDHALREAVMQLRVAGVPLQNLDPYQIYAPIPTQVAQNKMLNVRLNSTNLQEKTQAAFAKALADGHKINVSPNLQAVTQKSTPIVNDYHPELTNGNHHRYTDKEHGELVNGKSQAVNQNYEKIATHLPGYSQIIDSLENSLTEFSRQQRDLVQVHEQSLQNQTEYTKAFVQLMQQQHSLLANSPANEHQSQTQQLAIASSERNMMRFHDHQSDTLRIHEQYLNYQQEYTHHYFQLLQQHYQLLQPENLVLESPHHGFSNGHHSATPVENNGHKKHTATITVVPTTPTHIDTSTLSQTLLNIVSDKTGYPMEMLDLSMDIEADLGIDSIKRVEILGGLLELYPDLPKPNPEELGQLRTLGQIVAYIQTLIPELFSPQVEISEAVIAPAQQLMEVPTAVIQSEPITQVAESELAQNSCVELPTDLNQIFLNIVSDKTGYPAEMLDLSMDIEADLGIDSIKRVEILGGLLELYPDLPKPNPEELGQLRTLGQIVEYIQQQAASVTNLVTAQPSATTVSQLDHNIQRSIAKVLSLPEPDFLEFNLPKNHIILITDDGSETTAKLAANCLNKGWQTVVLSFPDQISTLDQGIHQVILADWQEETLEQKLAYISHHYGPIAAFIHLHPSNHDDTSHTVRYLETEKAILRHVFLIAKYLKEPLNQAANQGRSAFLAVTRLDGELGLAQHHNFGVIGAGLFGLTKSLNQEWEPVFCRSLDLSPDLDSDTCIHHIIAELHDPNLLVTEVGYSHKGRCTISTELTELIPHPSLSISKDQVFLVSGGAKGITAQCVIKLAQTYQCKFILLGRSHTEQQPVWAEGYENEAELKQRIMEYFLAQGEKPTPMMVQKKFQTISSQREIHSTLKAIEAAGGQAEYVSVDISDGVSLKEKLAPVVERWGEITGIIHGAGNLADKRIEKKSVQDFETVYTAKVKGLENLLHCVPPQQLKHLVLFSSVVGFYGNVGQCDYAIANEILNKSAHLIKLHHPHCHVLTINWGPWESGMVSPELKAAFAERGIETIPVDIGTQMLVTELTNPQIDHPQIIIGSPLIYIPNHLPQELKTYSLQRQLTLAANPFLHDHVIASRPVLPATCGLTWMANTCEQLYPGFKIFTANNFKVLKGIVFDENLAKEYTIDLAETAKINDQQIEFTAKISSNPPASKIRYHFSTNLILKREIPASPHYEQLNLVQDKEFLPISQSLYQSGGNSLFHGTTFQGVKSVLNASPEHLTIECSLPQPTAQQQGQFPIITFNPYIADVQIHSLWLWTQIFKQVGCLPSGIKTFEQFTPVPFGEKFYVTCCITSTTEINVVADVITYSPQGQIYNRMISAEGTFLPRQLDS